MSEFTSQISEAPTGSAKRLPTLQERYAEAYAWVRAQPCISYDFVHVPIESLAELLHLPNAKVSDSRE